MEFTIDRSTWICGSPINKHGLKTNKFNKHGLGETYLLNSEGFMCCLGQISIQLGIEKEKLLLKQEPNLVGIPNILCCLNQNRDSFDPRKYHNTELALNAMSINDDESFSREVREHLLIERFKKDGHTIKFINNYMDEDNRKVNQDIKEPISPIVCCA